MTATSPTTEKRLPRLGPRARLALLIGALLAAFVVFWIGDFISAERIRSWVDSLGFAAPVAYVAISAALGMMLVPGPILAGSSGLLFGAFLGSAVTLAASVLSAVGALIVARAGGAEGIRAMTGERFAAVAQTLERHGTVAVIVQRLAPGMPDAPASYAAGLVGIRVWQIALGTLIGSAPRAFSYTALGSTIDDPTSSLGIVAIVLIVLTGLVGTALAGRTIARARRPKCKPRR